jgi:hypothetical protein
MAQTPSFARVLSIEVSVDFKHSRAGRHAQQTRLHRTPSGCSQYIAQFCCNLNIYHLLTSANIVHCCMLPETERVVPGIDPDLPAAPRSENDIHIIFSTDCSALQHWQAMLLSYSAVRVGHTGPVTRIASNCTDAEVRALLPHGLLICDALH